MPVSVVIPWHYARANKKIAEELGIKNRAEIVYGFYHSLDGSNGYSFFAYENLKNDFLLLQKKELAVLIRGCEAFFQEQQKQINRGKRKIRKLEQELEKQASSWDDT